MANTPRTNTIYIDTNAEQVYNGRCKVAYIIHTASGANDQIVLRDGDGNTDPLKLSIKNPTANATMTIDLSSSPIIFQDGIYVSTLSAGSVCTLILTSGNGSN